MRTERNGWDERAERKPVTSETVSDSRLDPSGNGNRDSERSQRLMEPVERDVGSSLSGRPRVGGSRSYLARAIQWQRRRQEVNRDKHPLLYWTIVHLVDIVFFFMLFYILVIVTLTMFRVVKW